MRSLCSFSCLRSVSGGCRRQTPHSSVHSIMGCQAMTVILSDATSWLGRANQHRGSSIQSERLQITAPFHDWMSSPVTSLTRCLGSWFSIFKSDLSINGHGPAKQFYFTHWPNVCFKSSVKRAVLFGSFGWSNQTLTLRSGINHSFILLNL